MRPRVLSRALLFAAAAGLLLTPVGRAQEDGAGPGLSKQMRLAIELYEGGKDLDAMDRFMEILVKGDPAERPVANEYLNLITQRMSLGSKPEDKAPPTGPAVIERVKDEPRRRRRYEEEGGEAPPPARLGRSRPIEEMSRLSKSDRELMKREIEAKIRSRTRGLVEQLRRYEDLQVRMANVRLPRAIGIPTGMLFKDGPGVVFHKESGKIMELLSHLVFSLGATQVVLLPERAVLGDSKILDMRRTMAISSHLLKEGIAPSRIRVNLLAGQVDIPRDMTNFQGILVLFIYNQPLTLTTESTIGTESGPPLSLGVSPDTVDSKKGEGAIVEFSVMEPPKGLMSWRFQLLGPGEKAGSDMVLLQEVKGSAPVFHQIYWNARRKYFGKPLPAGRYECVLTATDMRNRSHKRHAWIKVEGPRPSRRAASARKRRAAPPSELEEKTRSKTAMRRKVVRRTRRKVGRGRTIARAGTRGRRPRPAKVAGKTIRHEKPKAATPAAAPAPAQRARSGAVNYQVMFMQNTANITPEGESILSRVADTMHYYPLDNINLVGYAYNGEPESQKLASQRADLVSKILIQQHGMKKERIRAQTKVVDHEAYKVEIYIVASGQ